MAKKKTSPENAAPRGSATPSTRIRLQRALASAGFGSRRHCEELIAEGRVIVDGVVADQLGTTVDLSTQKVFVDGSPLKPRRPIYYALNKPVGVVTTSVDPEGRPRVIDLVPPDERVFAVGRLDRNSEGLILLTNDGELAQKLAHPRFEIQKVYRVVVAGRVEPETLKQMERGIHIAEGLVRVEGAKLLKVRGRATELEIVLREGKNREIRRILARLGHKVQQLKRIAIGPLRLGEMPVGAHRQLSFEELKKLRAAVETDQSGSEPAAAPERRSPTGPRKRPGGPSKAFGRKKVSGRPASDSTQRARAETTVPTARKRGAKDLLDLSGGGKRKTIGTVIGADEAAEKSTSKSRLGQPITQSSNLAASRCEGMNPTRKFVPPKSDDSVSDQLRQGKRSEALSARPVCEVESPALALVDLKREWAKLNRELAKVAAAAKVRAAASHLAAVVNVGLVSQSEGASDDFGLSTVCGSHGTGPHQGHSIAGDGSRYILDPHARSGYRTTSGAGPVRDDSFSRSKCAAHRPRSRGLSRARWTSGC